MPAVFKALVFRKDLANTLVKEDKRQEMEEDDR